jgi:septum site-determining protein MinC
LLRAYKMLPIAVKSGSTRQMEDALAAGLSEAHGSSPSSKRAPAVANRTVDAPTIEAQTPEIATSETPAIAPPAASFDVSGTGAFESLEAVRVPDNSEAVHAASEFAIPSRSTLVVDKPLRSGQRVYAKGGDLIVLSVVSYGAEVIADGNIHVYAPLRGRALAGALGDTSARIFTTCMEPQLLSIAGIYRTTETELTADVLGKPAQVRLEGEKIVVEALKY